MVVMESTGQRWKVEKREMDCSCSQHVLFSLSFACLVQT